MERAVGSGAVERQGSRLPRKYASTYRGTELIVRGPILRGTTAPGEVACWARRRRQASVPSSRAVPRPRRKWGGASSRPVAGTSARRLVRGRHQVPAYLRFEGDFWTFASAPGTSFSYQQQQPSLSRRAKSSSVASRLCPAGEGLGRRPPTGRHGHCAPASWPNSPPMRLLRCTVGKGPRHREAAFSSRPGPGRVW